MFDGVTYLGWEAVRASFFCDPTNWPQGYYIIKLRVGQCSVLTGIALINTIVKAVSRQEQLTGKSMFSKKLVPLQWHKTIMAVSQQ